MELFVIDTCFISLLGIHIDVYLWVDNTTTYNEHIVTHDSAHRALSCVILFITS